MWVDMKWITPEDVSDEWINPLPLTRDKVEMKEWNCQYELILLSFPWEKEELNLLL